MRLCTIRLDGEETAGVLTQAGVVPVKNINAQHGLNWSTDLLTLIERGLAGALQRDADRTQGALDPSALKYAPLYRRPRKICGIGLNDRDHVSDLQEPFPTEPASFMKGDQTIIGPEDAIHLPPESERVTAEAELGLVIGRTCRHVSEKSARDVVAGYCLIIDMTAEDILQRNPRFLTRSKNFDSFFSFGPHLITPDEVPDVLALRMGTYKNGNLHRENVVSKMGYSPDYLVSFHSHVMTLYPGDIISTGTPGAVVIEHGDVAQCHIDGFGWLRNPVIRSASMRDYKALASVGA